METVSEPGYGPFRRTVFCVEGATAAEIRVKAEAMCLPDPEAWNRRLDLWEAARREDVEEDMP